MRLHAAILTTLLKGSCAAPLISTKLALEGRRKNKMWRNNAIFNVFLDSFAHKVRPPYRSCALEQPWSSVLHNSRRDYSAHTCRQPRLFCAEKRTTLHITYSASRNSPPLTSTNKLCPIIVNTNRFPLAASDLPRDIGPRQQHGMGTFTTSIACREEAKFPLHAGHYPGIWASRRISSTISCQLGQ